MSILNCQIVGFIGNDAELNENNGRTVVNFSVAHSVKFKTREGDEKKRTTWVNVAFWSDRAAKLQPFLKKGTLVSVDGEPFTRPYTNSTGVACASFDLTARSINLLSAAKNDDDKNIAESEQAKNQGFEKASEMKRPDFLDQFNNVTNGNDEVPF